MLNSCTATAVGTLGYLEATELQKGLHAKVAEGELGDQLLLLEHPHVYTLGRRGKLSDILLPKPALAEAGASVHRTDRGGEVTYHGPGQLVAYPILDLRKWGGGPLRYVRALERAVVATLAEFDVAADSSDRPTGVWVGDAKIAAIGVKISRGVTTHGLAINVDPDLEYFDRIVACGMPGLKVTSMSAILRKRVPVTEVAPVLANHFGLTFRRAIRWANGTEGLAADRRLAAGA